MLAAFEAANIEEYAPAAEMALQHLLQELCLHKAERTPVIDEYLARHAIPQYGATLAQARQERQNKSGQADTHLIPCGPGAGNAAAQTQDREGQAFARMSPPEFYP